MNDLLTAIANENLTVPQHIAIVMDGNGRWATQRGLPRIAGHYEGRKATKRVVQALTDTEVKALSLYAFSTENWGRPDDEVSGLMDLIETALAEELVALCEHNVRIVTSGRLQELRPSMQDVLARGREITAQNTGMTLNLCINYGGRAEIVDAARTLAEQVAGGKMSAESITEKSFGRALYAPELPDVELFIRPGRELRVSNFLLWEIAYAEFVLMDVLWPDFAETHILEALRAFNTRQRRFGQVVEQED